jgi:two-component system nitrate/nitrite sensor histidine kinase NarX
VPCWRVSCTTPSPSRWRSSRYRFSCCATASQKEKTEQVQTALDELDAGLRESINDVRELLVHFAPGPTPTTSSVRLAGNPAEVQTPDRAAYAAAGQGRGAAAAGRRAGAGAACGAGSPVQRAQARRRHPCQPGGASRAKDGALWCGTMAPASTSASVHGESHVGTEDHARARRPHRREVEITSAQGSGTTVTLTLPPHPVAIGQTVSPGNGPMR